MLRLAIIGDHACLGYLFIIIIISDLKIPNTLL